MKEKIKNQKSFIQIPLLIAIIISIIVVSTVATGFVLHRQGKLASFVANISKVFKKTEETSQQEQELEKARLEPKRIKQEAEKAETGVERLKTEQLEAQRLAEEQIDKTKLDDYVVEYTKDGYPLTWADLDGIAIIIKNEALDGNKILLTEIKKAQEDLEEMIVSMKKWLLKYPEDIQMQTLLNYAEAEEESGKKLIGFLANLIQTIQAYLESVEKRNEGLYFYYSKKYDELIAQHQNLVSDYMNKQKARQDYAKSLLAQ